MIGNINEITEGKVKGVSAFALFSSIGGYVIEINEYIADEFSNTATYSSVLIPAFTIWDKKLSFNEIEKRINGNLNEGAKQALLAANVRGVDIELYFHNKEAEGRSTIGRDFLNLFEGLSEKKRHKVEKIMFR